MLLELPGGGLLVDTPGFSYPSMHAAKAQHAAAYFPEIRRRLDESSGACQFADCTHTHEPGCCVDDDWERYAMYTRCRAPAGARGRVRSATGWQGAHL